jgi:hypothetical protein
VMGYALVKQPAQHVFSPDRFHHLVLLSLSELHVLRSVTGHVCSQLKVAASRHPCLKSRSEAKAK